MPMLLDKLFHSDFEPGTQRWECGTCSGAPCLSGQSL